MFLKCLILHTMSSSAAVHVQSLCRTPCQSRSQCRHQSRTAAISGPRARRCSSKHFSCSPSLEQNIRRLSCVGAQATSEAAGASLDNRCCTFQCLCFQCPHRAPVTCIRTKRMCCRASANRFRPHRANLIRRHPCRAELQRGGGSAGGRTGRWPATHQRDAAQADGHGARRGQGRSGGRRIDRRGRQCGGGRQHQGETFLQPLLRVFKHSAAPRIFDVPDAHS